MDSYEAHGVAVADIVLKVLSGSDPAILPQQSTPLHTFRIDARQLERWGLSTNDLPPDSTVLFKTPTLWEQHRNAVLGIAAAFGLQSIVVGVLIAQVRKRKAAEASLRESEERLAFAAASANVGIWRLDVSTGNFWITDHGRLMLGLRSEPVTMKSLLDVVHPDDRRSLAEAMSLATRRGAFIGGEFRVVDGEENTRWFVARGHAIADGGGPARISGIFADITDRKSAESEIEQQRREVSHLMRVSVLGELSGAIAHELNQPLTAILAYAQAARRLLGGANPELGQIAGVLDDIVHEDNRASEVIRRLHGLLRKGESKVEAISLNDLIESTLKLLRSEVIGRGVKLKVVLEPDLPGVSSDPVQLQQVLLNLLVNAMDAMNTTALADRVLAIRTRSIDDQFAEITIADRGHGLTDAQRAQIFKPFFTTKDQGLGLGLSICAKIVKASGGKLRIESNADGGVTASLMLPANVEAETVS